MSADWKCKEGDWIRFMKDNQLVIDVVVYRKEDGLGRLYVTMRSGEVREEEVLEWRGNLVPPGLK